MSGPEIWPARSLTPVLLYAQNLTFRELSHCRLACNCPSKSTMPLWPLVSPSALPAARTQSHSAPLSIFARCPQWCQRRNPRPQARIAKTRPQVRLLVNNFGPQVGSRAGPNLICRPGRRPECRLAPPWTRSRLCPRPIRSPARATVVMQR